MLLFHQEKKDNRDCPSLHSLMERVTYFADVAIPLAVEGYFTYRVPHDLAGRVKPGIRVVVQFGKKKIYTGLVRKVHTEVPSGYTPKYILSLLDPDPMITEIHFRFWEWIADYYMCSVGEVMSAALPAAFKLASETRLALHPGFRHETTRLSDKEFLVAEACELHTRITLAEVSAIVEMASVVPLIKSLIEKEVVVLEEELEERYKPRTVVYIRLNPEWNSDDRLNALFDTLEKKAPRQSEALMMYLSLSPGREEIARPKILAALNQNASGLEGLLKKSILIAREKVVSRLGELYEGPLLKVSLSPAQEEAFQAIRSHFENLPAVLLHGITSSGKTEIYIRLIEETLRNGGQILYLLPEIALTAQIINRLRRYFGEEIAVYHSKFNENERAEVWNRVSGHPLYHLKRFNLVVGARSALFLPFENLRLIIVDEEHDPSFRQAQPAPRYQARDAALFLAALTGAKTLLGTATPSLESYYNAQTGKFGWVTLNQRYGEVKLPQICIADIGEEHREKRMKSMFSELLLDEIGMAVQKGGQVILFQNRRGYAPRLECGKCHWIPQCRNCDVSLVYHKEFHQLKCHYCGWSSPVPSACPVCNHTGILMKSFGTEKIEDELSIFFPDAKVARLDLDAIRTRNAHIDLIRKFEDKEIDILVGTQMVTKGLDFGNVSLVGILNADSMLAFPDFRAFERGFQLMAQVSGRAGRKHPQGKVIIQTSNPLHPAIQFVTQNDYEGMYQSQIRERSRYHYPPFCRLVMIECKHTEAEVLGKATQILAGWLRKELKDKVLGPEPPLIPRIRGLYILQLLVKLERDQHLGKQKRFIRSCAEKLLQEKAFRQLRIQFHVDP